MSGNYQLERKAEAIAKKIKEKTKSPMPTVLLLDQAYKVIMNGTERDWLSEKELKQLDEGTRQING